MRLDNYAVAAAPRLGWRGWLRWMWRQVTSMRVALILLLLLGLASIPGSLLPQWSQNPVAVRQFVADYGWFGDVLNRLDFFDVFGSAWFTSIYLLLFLSLVGCIVPRTVAHARAARQPVAEAPRSLARYESRTEATTSDAAGAEARALAWFAARAPRRRPLAYLLGYRVRVDARGKGIAIAGEKGHLREWGNLLFHVSLVGVLVTVATGTMLTYRGQAIVVEGRAFTNAVAGYDTFESGRAFDPSQLDPFTLRLDSFEAEFTPDGLAVDFRANVTVTEPGKSGIQHLIRVNRPLHIGGAKVYLQGNGYAPDVTIRDASGAIVFAGPVPFLAQDQVYTSTGVIKVPDVTVGPQIGFTGTLLPSAMLDGDSAYSAHPLALNPLLVLNVYTGDLGLDTGVPQNVYKLDQSQLSPVRDEAGDVAVVAITPGQTLDLPDGLGSITFEALPRYVALDLRADPTLPYVLTCALAALLGLSMSLFGSRRRLWVTVQARAGTTVVTAAALAPTHDGAAGRLVQSLLAAVTANEEAPE